MYPDALFGDLTQVMRLHYTARETRDYVVCGRNETLPVYMQVFLVPRGRFSHPFGRRVQRKVSLLDKDGLMFNSSIIEGLTSRDPLPFQSEYNFLCVTY